MAKTNAYDNLQISMTRDSLKEAYAAIFENEKRGFEQVGHIGSFVDMNGHGRYVVKMRKAGEE
ncbi:hypothetical protein [Natribacillus halophilus]|nr:hypothetical protein [Natribacillus halophilus]